MAEAFNSVVDNKSCKTYFLLNDSKVYFTGDFDSGNLEKVQQLSLYTYRITPGFDKISQSTKKNFFYFRTFGFKQCRVKFQVTRVFLLQHLIKSDESSNSYHPVARRLPEGSFQKIKQNVKIYYNFYEQPQLSFYYEFQNQQQTVQFAFTYPYSYQDNQKLIAQLNQNYKVHSDIYFHCQTICTTKKERHINVITITSMKNCKEQRAQKIQGLNQTNVRPFKINQPTVVFSARAHPGESPSSFCAEGVLRFLLNQRDQRSAQLRKKFCFIIIPMINPDGVFDGMFRNSPNGLNLNRVYKNCDPNDSLQIWSIVRYINSLQRVNFFFDLHSHPSNKPFFIYGNSFENFIQQVQAQLFGKFLQSNCPYFENLQSVFSERAMKSKDKYDSYGKQGCARVFYHKKFKIIHSYTVECGYFAPTKLQQVQKYREIFDAQKGSYSFDWQYCSMEDYQPRNYMFLGKSLLISILDLFQINPIPKLCLSHINFIKNLRKAVAQKIYSQNDKFKQLQLGNYKKIKLITQLIYQKYYKTRFQPFGLSIISIQLKNEVFKQKNQTKEITKKRLATIQNIKLRIPNNNRKDFALNDLPTVRTSNEINERQSSLQITENSQSQPNFEQKIQVDSIHHKILHSFSKYEKKTCVNIQKTDKVTKSLINAQRLKTLQSQKSGIKILGRSNNSSIDKKKELRISSKLRYIEDQGTKKLVQLKIDEDIKQIMKLRNDQFKKVEKQKKIFTNSFLQLPSLKISYKNNSVIKIETQQH